MTFCPCRSSSDRGARYGAQAGATLGTTVGSTYGGPFVTGFNAGLGAALGYVGGSLLDRARLWAKPGLVPDGGERGARPSSDIRSDGGRTVQDGECGDSTSEDGPTEIPVTEGPLFE